METNQIAIKSVKQVVIKGQVELQGEMRNITITKWDSKNNVSAFYINVMGKKMYIGAGKETPKLTDIQNITFTFLPETATTENTENQ